MKLKRYYFTPKSKYYVLNLIKGTLVRQLRSWNSNAFPIFCPQLSFLKTNLKMLFNGIKGQSRLNHIRKKQPMDNLVKRLYLLYCPNCTWTSHWICTSFFFFFTICTTYNSTYMLFTHITQDCITKPVCESSKTSLAPCSPWDGGTKKNTISIVSLLLVYRQLPILRFKG